jgi:hypothetical protein
MSAIRHGIFPVVWTERKPGNLTDDQIAARFKGRTLVADWFLPNRFSFFLWHFPVATVANNADYYIVAALVGGNIATKMKRTLEEAQPLFEALVQEAAAGIITNEYPTFERIEAILNEDFEDICDP